MTQTGNNGVIPARSVRRTKQPVLLDCSHSGDSPAGSEQRPISVIPILHADIVAGLEVRCGCGAAVLIECLYDEEDQ